ncbi:MAG: prealbumin-like fold domain-containing protein, partial [Oscillospiraceae bacterium]|nr:prealbumin-like fold domain-containing protein [Oscillospiraceae bacterium]
YDQGVEKYLVMEAVTRGDSGASLILTANRDEATALHLYNYDGKYAIGFVVEGNNFKSLMDCYQNSDPKIFSVWGKGIDASPGNNNRFTLGLPDEGTVVYRYPEYSGGYGDEEPDTGTDNNLPPSMALSVSKVAEPSQRTYYSRNDFYQWNYEFVEWKVKDGTQTYQPNDTAVFTKLLELEAVWKFTGREEIEKTVVYDMAFTGTPLSEPGLSKTTVSNYREAVSGTALKSYEVSPVEPGYYRISIESNKREQTYEFIGWQTETGELITSAFIDLTENSRFDRNKDDVITLKAVWSGSYANSKSRQAWFFVSTVAISADAFNSEVQISTESRDFTDAVHCTLMEPRDMNAPTRTHNDVLNQDVFTLVTYDDASHVDVAGNDRLIRQLATTGLEADGQTFTLMDFPEDQEVLDYLKQQTNARLTLDGMEVDPVDMTTENFTVRWYICKYQDDGWHIDGKLTPNLSYLRITKTFLGDETALANIPEKFTIDVTSTRRSAEGIVTSTNLTDINLTLNDQRSHREQYGLYSGTATNGSFGYIDKVGDTYVWLVPVMRGAMFDITEKNYNAVVGSTVYGIAAQYSVTQAQSGATSETRKPWFGTVNGYSATYPRTAIDVSDTSNIQSVNLYNTYVETGVFVIQNIDAGLDGKGDTPMPGVKFSVYEIKEDGTEEPVKLTRKWNAAEGRYNLQVYYSGDNAIEGDPQTGEDGCIYLRLAAPNPEETQKKVFKIVEQVPDGYLRGAEAPCAVVTVDTEGNFSMGEMVQPAGEYGKMQVLKKGVPGAGDDEAIVSGLTIYNQPRPVSIAVGKSWDSVNPQNSVTLRLSGMSGTKEVISDEVVLTAENTVASENKTAFDPAGEWITRWTDPFPMMVGNVRVSYRVEETKIGAYAAGSASFSNWTQGYSRACYEGNTEVDADSSFSYDSIALDVVNSDRVKDFIKTTVFKTDGSGNKYLSGAVFEIYTERASSKSKIEFKEEYKYVVSAGKIEFTPQNMKSGIDLNLEFGKTYYLKETTTPAGCVPKQNGSIRISVDPEGQVSFAFDGDWKNGDTAFAFKDGSPATREAALKIKNESVGRDVAFRKVDSKGVELAGAAFTLYSDSACSSPVADRTVVSADGTSSKNSAGTTLAKGTVLFEKLPDGVYYMQEKSAGASGAPEGYASNDSTYVLLVGEGALHDAESGSGIFADLTSGQIQAQLSQYSNEKDGLGLSDEPCYAIFLIDSGTGKAVPIPDIAAHGILNEPAETRKVILRKTDTTSYAGLEDAHFLLYRADLSEVTDGQTTEQPYYESGHTGVFFIGELPLGSYYLVEVEAPTKVAGSATTDYSTNKGKLFKLTVGKDAEGKTATTVETLKDSGNREVMLELDSVTFGAEGWKDSVYAKLSADIPAA